MRHAIAALLALSLAPSVAAAGPLTAGINLGLSHSELDAEQGVEPGRTVGLFGRLAFNQRVAGQIEVARLQTEDEYSETSIRSATMSLVVDLGRKGHLVPTLVAGIGMDWASNEYGGSSEAHHIEGGLGLEYRAAGGLVLGIDVRMGGRSLHQDDDIAYPADVRGGVAYIVPSQLQEGEYRSAQIKLGVRF
ncbi:MAG: outer membrane beta-barrel protein [Deltaproteobacteria bacterium]|nr:outer membrane beta-barrel protein [Deltaproteobacteria bacterium]